MRGTAPAHAFGVSEEFRKQLQAAIVQVVRQAHAKLAEGEARLFFHLGQENTIGANSRLQLPRRQHQLAQSGGRSGPSPQPTGPFDPRLSQCSIFEIQPARREPSSTTTRLIPSALASDVTFARPDSMDSRRELEAELGGVVCFLEGASGSTHNINRVPVDRCVVRLKDAIRAARSVAQHRPVNLVAGIRRPDQIQRPSFRRRRGKRQGDSIRRKARGVGSFAAWRFSPGSDCCYVSIKAKSVKLGCMLIGDVAIVGVPAEFFTVLGIDIKRRSPFKEPSIAELANDWIGYLPDREGHRLGGYQTWMGLHSYAEPGTGERVADEADEIS